MQIGGGWVYPRQYHFLCVNCVFWALRVVVVNQSICFSEVQPRVSLFEGKNCQFSAHEKLSELILTEFKQVGTSVFIYIKYTKNLKRFDVYIYKSTNNDYSLIPV